MIQTTQTDSVDAREAPSSELGNHVQDSTPNKITLPNIVRCLGVTSTIMMFSIFIGIYIFALVNIYESAILVPVILAFGMAAIAVWSFVKLQITDMKSKFEETNDNIK